MALPTRYLSHLRHQRRVVASLGQTALTALLQRGKPANRPAAVPGPELVTVLPPRPPALIRDYLRHVGGDPGSYRGFVPAHMFPQWGFPLGARTLRGLPYPLMKVLNGGCRLEMRAPLPADEPLHVRACLDSIDENPRRAVLHQRVVTGTATVADAVVAHLYAIVPLAAAEPDSRNPGKPKDKPRVPANVRELAYWNLPADAGLAFAMLTGDFNPVHWLRPYARAFGFKNPILHGFATMARALEGLNRALFAGAHDRVEVFDVKFTRPLVLPAKVGLYLDDREAIPRVYVGDAPGGGAYLVGTFSLRA